MSRVGSLVVGGTGGAAPEVVATITAIPDQDDLSAVTLTIAVTVDGSPVTPSAVAWLVNGAATGIADATAETTTHTPTAGGVHVVTCEVEVDGRPYFAEAEIYTVGDADGKVTVYAPDLAALASADWRSGGPSFAVGGVTWTVRNQSTFSTGELGPDGSTGLRMKPSSTGVDWLDATHSVGAVDFSLSSAVPGLSKNTPYDVIYAFRCDGDVSLDYHLFGAYVCNNPHTSDPRGAYVVRVNVGANKIVEVQRRDGTTQAKANIGNFATIRAYAWRIEGMTARLFLSTSAVTSLPDSSFTGWTELGPFAMDARDPNTAAQFTVANMTSGFICGLAGTPAATLDITLTGLWVRARL